MRYAANSEIPPCMDCPDREIGCHGKCPKYAEYGKRCEEARQRRRAEESGLIEVIDEVVRSSQRMKRRGHRK